MAVQLLQSAVNKFCCLCLQLYQNVSQIGHFSCFEYLTFFSSPVQSSPVLSCPFLSCPVLSPPVLSRPVLSHPVLYLTFFKSSPALSRPVCRYQNILRSMPYVIGSKILKAARFAKDSMITEFLLKIIVEIQNVLIWIANTLPQRHRAWG